VGASVNDFFFGFYLSFFFFFSVMEIMDEIYYLFMAR
jgi:hypothetical protein